MVMMVKLDPHGCNWERTMDFLGLSSAIGCNHGELTSHALGQGWCSRGPGGAPIPTGRTKGAAATWHVAGSMVES